jgi:hypothetical protein
VGSIGVEKKRVTRFQGVGFVGMTVSNPTLKHINQFGTRVLKHRKHLGLIIDGNQLWLDVVGLANRMTQQLILMASAGTTALDRQAFPGLDIGDVALLFVTAKERRDRNL